MGAAVLIRALEPLEGSTLMRERRGLERVEDLCTGPGKLDPGARHLARPERKLPARRADRDPRRGRRRATRIVTGTRIGINKAVELPWRFCDADSGCVSRPWPPGQRAAGAESA